MEKRTLKTHCLGVFEQISDFLLVIHSNCMVPVFQGGDLYVIMEIRPHKTHCLSGFVQISEVFACNPFKLRDPRFPRG